MAPLCHVSLALEEEMEHNQENLVYAPPQLPEKLHHRATLEQDVAFRWTRRKPQPSVISQALLVRWVLAVSFPVTTVNLRLYAM
ncbi:hypothetical protein CapIbe_017762 [Capra ibex]